jgi:hypothetical protein
MLQVSSKKDSQLLIEQFCSLLKHTMENMLDSKMCVICLDIKFCKEH